MRPESVCVRANDPQCCLGFGLNNKAAAADSDLDAPDIRRRFRMQIAGRVRAGLFVYNSGRTKISDQPTKIVAICCLIAP